MSMTTIEYTYEECYIPDKSGSRTIMEYEYSIISYSMTTRLWLTMSMSHVSLSHLLVF